ncbi:MAG: O-antigen ligase family protein [Candidatus Margulisiibacteriota bacterium]
MINTDLAPFIMILMASLIYVMVGMRYTKQTLFLILFYAAFYYWYYAFLANQGLSSTDIHEPVFLKLLKDILILSIYAFCLSRIFISKKMELYSARFYIPLACFIVLVIVQTIRGLGENVTLSLIALRNMTIFMPIVFCVPMLIKDKADIKLIIRVLIFGAIIVSLIGVYEYFGGKSIYHDFAHMYNIAIIRIYSTLYNTNNLAIYLNIFLMICFSFYLNKIYIINKYISQMILSLFGFCLLATQSRSGLIMFMLGLTYLLFINRRRKAFVIITVTFISLTLLVQAFVPTLFYRNSLLLEQSDNWGMKHVSVGARAGMFSIAKDIIDNDPNVILWGMGTYRVGVASALLYVESEFETVRIGDNYFLEIFVGMGILGLLFFIWILLSILWESLQLFREIGDPYLKCLVGAIGAIVLSFSAEGLMGSLWNLFPNNLYFWFFTGLLISIKNYGRKNASLNTADHRAIHETI